MTATQTKCSRSAHSCPKQKKRAKNYIGKFVKSTGYTKAFNSLTNFEFKAYAMTRNGNYVNILKLTCKNLWNRCRLFSSNFRHLEQLCGTSLVGTVTVRLSRDAVAANKPEFAFSILKLPGYGQHSCLYPKKHTELQFTVFL